MPKTKTTPHPMLAAVEALERIAVAVDCLEKRRAADAARSRRYRANKAKKKAPAKRRAA